MPKAEKERPCLEQGETLVVYMLGAREKGSNYRKPVPWPNHHHAQYLPFTLLTYGVDNATPKGWGVLIGSGTTHL